MEKNIFQFKLPLCKVEEKRKHYCFSISDQRSRKALVSRSLSVKKIYRPSSCLYTTSACSVAVSPLLYTAASLKVVTRRGKTVRAGSNRVRLCFYDFLVNSSFKAHPCIYRTILIVIFNHQICHYFLWLNLCTNQIYQLFEHFSTVKLFCKVKLFQEAT